MLSRRNIVFRLGLIPELIGDVLIPGKTFTGNLAAIKI